MHKSELILLGRSILNSYTKIGIDRSLSIFLCGGSMTGNSARELFHDLCKNEKNLSVKFPEGLFDELLEKNAYNLLELEELLANSVDAIVIFPESPGSFAELGAFAESTSLRDKIVCISERKYSRNFSFINLGPIRILKKSPSSKVIEFSYKLLNTPIASKDLVSKVIKYARQIKNKFPSKQIALFALEELIIFSLFCLDTANWDEIKSIYLADDIGIESKKMDKVFDVCVSVLLATNKIEKDENGRFFLSERTLNWVLTSIPKHQLRYLQGVRVEVMNSYLRRHAEFKDDRIHALPL